MRQIVILMSRYSGARLKVYSKCSWKHFCYFDHLPNRVQKQMIPHLKALIYRVDRKYLNPWCGISTSWDMPIKICMAILIDKMQLSREFKGYRCNMKKIIEPSFSWFWYRFLVVCIWDFGLLKVKGHSHKMAKVTKKIFTGPKN